MTAPAFVITDADNERFAVYGDVLAFLARLHDREPDAALLEGIHDNQILEWLTEAAETPATLKAVQAFGDALHALPVPVDAETIDELACAYADIYLNYSYRLSPAGSVWLTEDNLERQIPMFTVRAWYEHYGFSVPNWRIRSDDHIVHELQFLGHLCQNPSRATAVDAARFLDQNVLCWFADFCTGVKTQARQPFFAAGCALTLCFLEALRDRLEQLTGIKPLTKKDLPEYASCDVATEQPYMPGIAESW